MTDEAIDSTEGQEGTALAGSALTFLVLAPEQSEVVMARANTLLETANRHELELVRAGARKPKENPNGNCSNCVLC